VFAYLFVFYFFAQVKYSQNWPITKHKSFFSILTLALHLVSLFYCFENPAWRGSVELINFNVWACGKMTKEI